MEERQKILNNILDITDKNGNQLVIKNICLEFSCNKYSSKKNSIYHIVFNDKHLSKKNTHLIKYKCLTCESVHKVGVTQFLRKINKCSKRCNLCCNQELQKRENHSKFLKAYEGKEADYSKTLTLNDKKEESILLFQDLDDDFKTKYFQYHLTMDDYERIMKHLVSLQNGKVILDDSLEFWPIFKTNNQMLFTGVFYDKSNDMIIKANQPIMKCQNCQKTWRAKTLEKFKNCHKILCTDCVFCNKVFKIRATKNNINESILYQSKLELKFIQWCNNNNITVKNGPVLQYIFENKLIKYKVDFQIENLLIEIKDNHIWHINEIESGKWKEKENIVNEEIKKGRYEEYYLVTPKNWVYSINKIKDQIRYSLNSYEKMRNNG
jgi:hypothetical protein